MSIITGYYNSLNGDRKYNAETMSKYFVGLITKGVLQNYKEKFVVKSYQGMKVKVPTGKAYFSDGKWIENTADITLTIDPSDVVLNRIDRIVLRNDKSEGVRTGIVLLKKGSPASNPIAPVLENNDYIEELSLATIRINKLVESITQSDITNTIPDNEQCGYVTGLIQQVDTSDLYLQYQTAYENFRIESELSFNTYMRASREKFDKYMSDSKIKFDNYMEVNEDNLDQYMSDSKIKFDSYMEESENGFNSWFDTIRDKLIIATMIRKYTNHIVTSIDNTSSIQIGIPQYEPVLDILEVFINGMCLIEGKDYTKTATSITLTLPIDMNQDVYFVVYKAIDTEKAITVLEQVEDLISRVNALENK